MQTARRRPFGELGNMGSQHLLSARGEIRPKLLPTASSSASSASSSSSSSGTSSSLSSGCSSSSSSSVVGSSCGEVGRKVSSPVAPLSPKADEKHRNDPLYMADTCKDIFEHFQRAETKRRPNTNYMSLLQTDVNEKMRAILIDWLVDVHLKFKLQPETLYLSVEIIDRFLEKKVVNRQKLQLVGVVGMLLAAKYEEIYPPEVKDFIYIAANTYSREDILRMERLIFQTLDFNITLPTVYVFLKRGLQVCEAPSNVAHMAQFFAEMTMMDYSMLAHLPSTIAASCLLLAHKALEPTREAWGPTLEYYLGYSAADLEPCASEVLKLVRAAATQKTQAIRKKYAYARYGEVSKVPLDHVLIP